MLEAAAGQCFRRLVDHLTFCVDCNGVCSFGGLNQFSHLLLGCFFVCVNKAQRHEQEPSMQREQFSRAMVTKLHIWCHCTLGFLGEL